MSPNKELSCFLKFLDVKVIPRHHPSLARVEQVNGATIDLISFPFDQNDFVQIAPASRSYSVSLKIFLPLNRWTSAVKEWIDSLEDLIDLYMLLISYHISVNCLFNTFAVELFAICILYRINSACIDEGMHSDISPTCCPNLWYNILSSLVKLGQRVLIFC